MISRNGGQGSCSISKKLITDDTGDAFTTTLRNNHSSAAILKSSENNEIEAKHQILSAEDIRHFMQPHLPPSNSIIGSFGSTDAYANNTSNDRFIRDKAIFYMSQLSQKHSKINQPKCCCLKIITASIGSALITGVLISLLIAYVIGKHISAISYSGESSARLTGTLIMISGLVLIFIGLFIGGILRRRQRWLLPLILSMICLCVALFGAFVAVMITIVDDANEVFDKHPSQRVLNIVNIVVLRSSILVLLAFGIPVTVCYIRCYRYVALLHGESKHFIFPSTH